MVVDRVSVHLELRTGLDPKEKRTVGCFQCVVVRVVESAVVTPSRFLTGHTSQFWSDLTGRLHDLWNLSESELSATFDNFNTQKST